MLALQLGIALLAVQRLAEQIDHFRAAAAGPPGSIQGLIVASIVFSIIALLLVPVLIVGVLKRPDPDRDYLELGPDGLVYRRGGDSRFWPWRSLPAFKPIHSFRQIQFVLPDPVAGGRCRDPWIHEETPDGPVVAISDIYDTPFDEVAARLNEYRERAIRGGDGSP